MMLVSSDRANEDGICLKRTRFLPLPLHSLAEMEVPDQEALAKDIDALVRQISQTSYVRFVCPLQSAPLVFHARPWGWVLGLHASIDLSGS